MALDVQIHTLWFSRTRALTLSLELETQVIGRLEFHGFQGSSSFQTDDLHQSRTEGCSAICKCYSALCFSSNKDTFQKLSLTSLLYPRKERKCLFCFRIFLVFFSMKYISFRILLSCFWIFLYQSYWNPSLKNVSSYHIYDSLYLYPSTPILHSCHTYPFTFCFILCLPLDCSLVCILVYFLLLSLYTNTY